MGFFFIIGIFTAFIQLPLFFGMQYYFLQGGGIAKILGGDSAEQVRPDIRWGDVIGMENAKRDAWEIVEFLRDQTRLKTIGGKIIKGTMFLGPPGCGKTYLAKAIATEAGLPFYQPLGDFVRMLVGQGAAKCGLCSKAERWRAFMEGASFLSMKSTAAMPRRADADSVSNQPKRHDQPISYRIRRLAQAKTMLFSRRQILMNQNWIRHCPFGRFDRKIRVTTPAQKIASLIQFYITIKYDPQCRISTLAKETMWSRHRHHTMIREAAIFAQREKRAKSPTEIFKAKQHTIAMLTKNGGRNIAFAQQHVLGRYFGNGLD